MYLLSLDFDTIASSVDWLNYSTLLFNCPYCRKFLFKLPSIICSTPKNPLVGPSEFGCFGTCMNRSGRFGWILKMTPQNDATGLMGKSESTREDQVGLLFSALSPICSPHLTQGRNPWVVFRVRVLGVKYYPVIWVFPKMVIPNSYWFSY